MNIVEHTDGTRRFALDEEAIPESQVHTFRSPLGVPYANHGRSIARDERGRWYCAFVSTRGIRNMTFLYVAVSDSADAVGGDFHPAIPLLGNEEPWPLVFGTIDGTPRNSCALVDDKETLHLLFDRESGIFHATADVSGDEPHGRLTDRTAWTGPEQIAGEGCSLGDAVFLPDGSLAVYGRRGSALFECVLGGEPTDICDNGEHPSVFVNANGERHVAFERDRRVFYTCSADGNTWADSNGAIGAEMVAFFCSSWPSIAATTDGKLVIAYQGEGKVDLQRFPEMYRRLRPGAGSTVSYAVRVDGEWRIHDFLRSSEILLKRRVTSSLPGVGGGGSFKQHLEEFWRPTLSMDKHGVLWMFFLNTTRRHIYFARFGGETFGEHYEARGAYDAPSRQYFVQKDARNHGTIGFMMVAAGQVHFDAIEVPDYVSTEPRRVVFLDNMELAETVGVEQELGQWEKHPGPLALEGPAETPQDKFPAWCQARVTDTGYELHYMSQGAARSNWMPGRATSSDGLHWQIRDPFDMSLLTLDGEPFPSYFWRPCYLEDVDESDPMRRYKGLLGKYHLMKGIELRTWVVVTSPDALAWHTVEGLDPIVVGDISVNFHLFKDPWDKRPERRYKMSALMGAHAGRCATVFTSPDLIHWNRPVWLREDPDNPASPVSPYPTGPIMLDPDGGESPWEEEIHDAALWRENGILMAHYDAFYFHYNQHIEKALGVSRDGRHYWRVKRGAIDMRHGNCGEWDSGRNRTCIPIRVGDELWMYFCGMPAGYFSDPEETNLEATAWNHPEKAIELRPWGLGLAKLRVDGWAYLQLERNTGTGHVTTIPFEYKGGALVVNGSGLGPSGLSVELRDAENRAAIPGFAAADCIFSAADSVVAKVTWREGKSIEPGAYRLRFSFEGLHARLYAFGFE